MQLSDVQQRFSRVEQCIGDASRACQESASVPPELKQSIQQLDQRSSEARQLFQGQGQDESRIRDCVNELEELSDQALDACSEADNIEPQLKQAVQQTHSELSSLKKQMG